MTSDNDSFPFLAPLRRYVPLAVWVIAIFVIIAIPFKIIGYGYLPGDDALRHAARAVSGKPWSEILVLNPVYKMDHEFGWNWLLGRLHVLGSWNAETLVIFSVALLFILVNMAGMLWLKRPEAWLISLIGSMVLAYIPLRLVLGRPYLITAAAVMSILYLWRLRQGTRPRKSDLLVMAVMTTCSVFFHGAWYLWVLPLAAFFLAGEFIWCLGLGVCWVAGVIIGSALTGHPLEYPVQAVQLASLALGAHFNQRTMASELQPFSGDAITLIAFGGLLLARALTRINSVPLLRDPAFWLAAMCWVLGFKVARFWIDWGWPALMVLAAFDVQLLMEARLAQDSFKRLGTVCCIALATYLCVTSDFGGRWSSALSAKYLTTDNPNMKDWMPDKGGIFYTVDMSLFYQTFYKNPDGDWRYMLGFEPTWMPKTDFETYRNILWYGDPTQYEPWVTQMTPADRLVLRDSGPPAIAGLEWKSPVAGIWVGRKPGTNSIPETPKR